MITALDHAVAEARKLPVEQQETLAALLLQEIEADAAWERRLSASGDLLARLADEALAELEVGQVVDGDPSDRR